MKTCARCHAEKPLDEFNRQRAGGATWNRQAYCKPCQRESAREWQRRNPDRAAAAAKRAQERLRNDPERLARARAYQRKWQQENREQYLERVREGGLRRRYGMSSDQLKAMLAQQDGKCALCSTAVTWETRHVDHIDTDSRPVVRGILCSRCNNGLGFFREDADLLNRAAEYVMTARFYTSQLGPLEALTS